jgi:hypothetical protein
MLPTKSFVMVVSCPWRDLRACSALFGLNIKSGEAIDAVTGGMSCLINTRK